MTAAVSTFSDASALAGAQPDRGPSGTPMHFSGQGRAFLKIIVSGALLQIPTFGFYRFWLNTRLRRHLWSHTLVGGEGFEYTGTAKELLIGFFIAVAISVPIYLASTIVSLLAEEWQAFASVPFVLAFLLLGQFAAYRARRYRATRTVFRGLRFWMTRSGWNYAFRAAGWTLLVVATLGLALPWAMASLERYTMRNTHYGTLKGDFVGEAKDLFRRGIALWVLAVPLPAAVIGAIVWSVRGSGQQAQAIASSILTVAMLALFGTIIPFVAAIIARWRANGLRFGPVALHCDLRPGAFFGTYAKLCLSWLGAFVALAAVFGLLFAANAGKAALAAGQGPGAGFFVVTAVAFLSFSLVLGIINRYFMQRGLWAILVGSVTVSNLSALDGVKAAGRADDAIGEGMLDAFDGF